jgi:hypothetical protein
MLEADCRHRDCRLLLACYNCVSSNKYLMLESFSSLSRKYLMTAACTVLSMMALLQVSSFFLNEPSPWPCNMTDK